MKISVKVVMFIVLAGGALAEGVNLCCGNPPCKPPIVCNVR
jgi:hypothetical protein